MRNIHNCPHKSIFKVSTVSNWCNDSSLYIYYYFWTGTTLDNEDILAPFFSNFQESSLWKSWSWIVPDLKLVNVTTKGLFNLEVEKQFGKAQKKKVYDVR